MALPAAVPYPARARAFYVIGVLFVVTLSSQLDRQLPALVVAPLRAAFHISDTEFSLLQSYAFALPFTLMALPFGRLVDSRQRRSLILTGLLFWSAATVLFAFAGSYAVLVLARVGVGIGEAVLAPAAFSLIADLVAPSLRGRALAGYSVSIAIGSGASLLLGGWLLAAIPPAGLAFAGVGPLPAWRVAFLVAALPALPLALLLLATVQEPARQRDTVPGGAPEETSLGQFIGYLRQQPATFSRLLSYPAVLSFMGYGSLTWAPALFERSHGVPAARSGVILGVGVAVAGTVGMLAGGVLSDRWFARGVQAARLRVALAGVALAALPAVAWPLVPGPAPAFALLFLLVFGIALGQSAVPASVQGVFPNRLRGQAVGSYLLLSGLLGIGLAPTAVALVTDHVFHDDRALPCAIALTAAPAALFGLWLLATGLVPYARMHAALHAPAPWPPDQAAAAPP
jgi:MFS family permease